MRLRGHCPKCKSVNIRKRTYAIKSIRSITRGAIKESKYRCDKCLATFDTPVFFESR